MRKIRPRHRLLGSLGAVCAAVLVVAACSSGSSSSSGSGATGSGGGTVSINVGTGTIKWPKGQKLNIAYLTSGSSNGYLVKQNSGAVAAAKAYGVQLTTFDANFDPTTQISELQDALTSGKYNAFIVDPVFGQVECRYISQLPLQDNVLVSVMVTPACDKGPDNAAATWQPGTLDFIGGPANLQGYQAVWAYAAAHNPGPQTVAYFSGPTDLVTTQDSNEGLAAVQKQDPDFKVVATYDAEYSTSDGLSDAQEMLAAHPNVNIILSQYSGQTQGIVKALAAAGKLGKVKIYDSGGDTFDQAEVANGQIEAAGVLFPYNDSYSAVQQLVAATQGQSVPRYVGNDGHPEMPGQGSEPIYIITKQNAATFTPQY
jgi:ribose transport system substrate-binding protein